jgi:hypothetical protein
MQTQLRPSEVDTYFSGTVTGLKSAFGNLTTPR